MCDVVKVIKRLAAREIFRCFAGVRGDLGGKGGWGDEYDVRTKESKLTEKVIQIVQTKRPGIRK